MSNLYFQIDADGYILQPDLSLNDMPEYNRRIVNKVLELLINKIGNNLRSVLIRGSQLFGTFKSDFDFVVVTRCRSNFSDKYISEFIYERLSLKFSQIISYDILSICEEDLEHNDNLKFIVKVLAIEVYGYGIKSKINGFKIDDPIQFHLKKLTTKMPEFISSFDSARIEKKVLKMRMINNYIVKYLTRCSFELVMNREQCYTRELFTCSDCFIKYYPEHKNLSLCILDAYDKNNLDANLFFENFKSFGNFLINEAANIKII